MTLDTRGISFSPVLELAKADKPTAGWHLQGTAILLETRQNAGSGPCLVQ